MRYNGTLIYLNGKAFKNITGWQPLRSKLWADDTGRNMAGSFRGSFIGNFPKLQIEFGPTDDEDIISELIQIFDEPIVSVKYYNPKYKTYCTADFYSGDYGEQLLLALDDELYFGGMTVNLVPVEKEADHVREN